MQDWKKCESLCTFDQTLNPMDLKFSKTKIQLIKEIEACEDEALLLEYLADFKGRKSEGSASPRFPATVEAYRKGVERSAKEFEEGKFSTLEQVEARFAKRDRA